MSLESSAQIAGRRTFLVAGFSFLASADMRSSEPGVPASAQLVPVNPIPGRLSEAEFIALAARVSNWGKWGPKDTLGALNLITPGTIRRASAEIREGITISCGAPIPSLVADAVDNSGNLKLWIDAGGQWGAVNDRVTLEPHGHDGLTHLDALGHIYYRGTHYNGVPFGGVLGDRVKAMGIDAARQGVTARGVLIDLPAAVGKPWLDQTDRVTPTELRRAIEAAGTKLMPGDVLVFNTGYHAQRLARGGRPRDAAPTGGMQIECAEIVHAASPSLIVSDAGMDTMPSEVVSVLIPWHIACIVMMGVQLVDGAALGDLLEVCGRLKRSSFFCTVAPVAYVGGTASPVNPICIF